MVNPVQWQARCLSPVWSEAERLGLALAPVDRRSQLGTYNILWNEPCDSVRFILFTRYKSRRFHVQFDLYHFFYHWQFLLLKRILIFVLICIIPSTYSYIPFCCVYYFDKHEIVCKRMISSIYSFILTVIFIFIIVYNQLINIWCK